MLFEHKIAWADPDRPVIEIRRITVRIPAFIIGKCFSPTPSIFSSFLSVYLIIDNCRRRNQLLAKAAYELHPDDSQFLRSHFKTPFPLVCGFCKALSSLR